MYVSGLNPTIQEIYPKVEFPVGRGTPSIHDLPIWDHTKQYIPSVSLNKTVNHIKIFNIKNLVIVKNIFN